jgi:oligoribonuclease (3'-5' exoribonuclease)
MSLTPHDLTDFQQFASERVNVGDVRSLVQLANEWEARRANEDARREMDEAVADIHASHADLNAGRTMPAANAFEQVRRQLGRR